jgi:cytochrome c oxidase subunit 2
MMTTRMEPAGWEAGFAMVRRQPGSASARLGGSIATRVAVLVAAALLVGGCAATAGTEQGRDVRSLYDLILIPAGIIFVLVEGLIIWSVIRYRRRDDALPVQTEGNRTLEIVWTVIPAIIVAGVFALSMQTLGKVDAKSADPAVVVDVKGHQWYWEFAYEKEAIDVSGIGGRPEIVLPVGKTIRFNLQSSDVIHSFYVSNFLFKRDVIPGVTNAFEITIDTPATYSGQCAEFCGLAHADMTFAIRAVAQADYDAWVADQQRAASATPAASLAPSAAASGGASAPAGPTLEVSASTPTSFEQNALSAPAGQAFSLHFDNKDPQVPHDVAVKDSSGKILFQGEIVTGPATATYPVPALQAGSYTFFCIVHPNMQGTLTVQ